MSGKMLDAKKLQDCAKFLFLTSLFLFAVFASLEIFEGPAVAYPPAVGIAGKSRTCLTCHADNGPWEDDDNLIIDIVNKETGESLMRDDGSFLITAERGETITLLTIIGRTGDDENDRPTRNGWIYLDPERIDDDYSLSVFASGWGVNLPLACRVVGDRNDLYPDANLTALPMKIRPGEDARDTEMVLQLMLTSGNSVKGKPSEGLIANYFERTVLLKIIDSSEDE